jgi:excinuclease ABC subunit B
MERAIGETNRRRTVQMEYNKKHGITPKTIIKKIQDITEAIASEHQKTVSNILILEEKEFSKNPKKFIKMREKQMNQAVKALDFETAAILRDEIKVLAERILKADKKAEKEKKELNKGVRAKKQWMQG